MRWIVLRVVAAAALSAGVAACKVSGHDGCIIGPCATTGPVGVYPITLVTGFPSSRVSGSTGLLAPGDTVRLSVVRVPSSALPCARPPPQYVTICPAGGLIADFRVAP